MVIVLKELSTLHTEFFQEYNKLFQSRSAWINHGLVIAKQDNPSEKAKIDFSFYVWKNENWDSIHRKVLEKNLLEKL